MCCSWNPNSWEVVRHPGRANGSACPGSNLPTASFPWDSCASGTPPEISVCLAVAWGFSVLVVSLIEHLGTLVQVSRQGAVPFAHKPQELHLAICVPCDSPCGPQVRDAGQGRYLSPVQRYRKEGIFVPRSEVQDKEGILRAFLLQFSC